MKKVLEKPWAWDENILMYFDHKRPVMLNFPFLWYHIQNNEIRLIKQISKNCSVIFGENKWVEQDERTAVAKMDKRNAYYESDNETATNLERRSWTTLGEVADLEPSPKEVTIMYEEGGGCIYKFHPVHGQILQSTYINQDGEIYYKSMFLYNDQNFAVEYGNTFGDKWEKVWNKEKEKYIWNKL